MRRPARRRTGTGCTSCTTNSRRQVGTDLSRVWRRRARSGRSTSLASKLASSHETRAPAGIIASHVPEIRPDTRSSGRSAAAPKAIEAPGLQTPVVLPRRQQVTAPFSPRIERPLMIDLREAPRRDGIETGHVRGCECLRSYAWQSCCSHGHPDSLARTASSTFRPEGSTPRAARAPPSTTISPSTSTLNSPYLPRTISTSVRNSRRSRAATRTACSPDTQYAQ